MKLSRSQTKLAEKGHLHWTKQNPPTPWHTQKKVKGLTGVRAVWKNLAHSSAM